MIALNLEAENVSEAWLLSAASLDAEPGQRAFHLVIRIAEPTSEVPAVRTIVDRMIVAVNKRRSEAKQLHGIQVVRNTIFPAEIARTSRDSRHLAERYRAYYPTLKKYKGNRGGTYFGRLVELPSPDGAIDQLNNVIDKLADQKNRHRRTRFELDLGAADVAVYRAQSDRQTLMGFPCLSFCSFQRESETLHMTAFYRHQYMIGRAYGNYLGLGQLLEYVASCTGHKVGELMVVAGHAELDQDVPRTLYRPFLERAKKVADGANNE